MRLVAAASSADSRWIDAMGEFGKKGEVKEWCLIGRAKLRENIEFQARNQLYVALVWSRPALTKNLPNPRKSSPTPATLILGLEKFSLASTKAFSAQVKACSGLKKPLLAPNKSFAELESLYLVLK